MMDRVAEAVGIVFQIAAACIGAAVVMGILVALTVLGGALLHLGWNLVG